jgi:hypothetical protein
LVHFKDWGDLFQIAAPAIEAKTLNRRNTMNCKPGDLAMIIGDEESCIMNIGRIVEVHGPMTQIEGKDCWGIVPIHPEPIMVREGTELSLWRNVTLADGICHVDAWLKPLPPMTEEEKEQLVNFKLAKEEQ